MVKTETSSRLSSQILYKGAQELLGFENLRQILAELGAREEHPRVGDEAGSLSSSIGAGAFFRHLEKRFGVQGGRGLALRIGRAAFQYALKDQAAQMGLHGLDYRLLPAPRRIETGLGILARTASGLLGENAVVSEEDAHWLWRVERGSASGDRQRDASTCYLAVGFLQEFTSWAGGGRYYRVAETECCASGGAACVFRIEKKPLD